MDQSAEAVEDSGSVFEDISADTNNVIEIENLCMNCGENGNTRLLLTRIPHFREIVVMAFECPNCHFRNSEVQNAGLIMEKGSTQTCLIVTKEDLNRQIVKSDSASIKLVELDLEIPNVNRKGYLTTVEGLLGKVIEDLSSQQPIRKTEDEHLYKQIESVITRLKAYEENLESFTVVVDDPAGNSYIENLCLPNADPKLKYHYYTRTKEQDVELGLATPEEDEQLQSTEKVDLKEQVDTKEEENNDDKSSEVMVFAGSCPSCHVPCETRMTMLDIPNFKECLIMATNCMACGFKSNEVKSSGPISPKGKRIILKVTDVEDLSRDILKSETCGLNIPEIDLHLQYGTLGGRFTTVEGLLSQVYDELSDRAPFLRGDSAPEENRNIFSQFLAKLKSVINFEMEFTLILDDPVANSYLQNPYAPDEDPNMTIEFYERSFEENEDLGLNDLVLEGYENDNAAQDDSN